MDQSIPDLIIFGQWVDLGFGRETAKGVRKNDAVIVSVKLLSNTGIDLCLPAFLAH